MSNKYRFEVCVYSTVSIKAVEKITVNIDFYGKDEYAAAAAAIEFAKRFIDDTYNAISIAFRYDYQKGE